MSLVSPSTRSVNTKDIFQTGLSEEKGDCLHSIDAPIGNATHGMSSSIVGHKVTCHNIFPAFLCEDRFRGPGVVVQDSTTRSADPGCRIQVSK